MTTQADPPSLKLIVESILFVAGKPVELALLSRISGCRPEELSAAVDEMAAEWQARGLRLQRSGSAVQMVTAPEVAPYVQTFLGIDENQRLTHSVLIVLTVIAYKQPITRPALEKILGKSCDWALSSLKARDLITEVGRAKAPGRPYLYGTTFRFLEHFGLEKPEDLPPLPEIDILEGQTAEVEGTGDEAETAGVEAVEAEAEWE